MHVYKVSELGRVVTGKTPPTSNQKYYGGDYMFVTPADLHREAVVRKSEKTITEEGMNSIASNTISGSSVLVGCIGWDMGNVAMVKTKCATNQQINAITDIRDIAVPEYIYYWFSLQKNYLFSIASVTRTPILSKSVFEQIEIPLPSKRTQKAVASVLGAIDKQIALNNQINDNLAALSTVA